MRILSGIQPSGKLHIGNYFGMMRPALELAQKGNAFYFIADYHSLTSVANANELRANVRDVALDFLACGLDPQQTVFCPAIRRAAGDGTGLGSVVRDADADVGERGEL